VVRTLVAASLCGPLAARAATPPHPAFAAWKPKILAYLESLARPDGGYAWPGEPFSHLSPTFAVVGAYHTLGERPPTPAKLAEFIRTHHPFHLNTLERELKTYEYQQIQSLLWLGEDASDFRAKVLSWKHPLKYAKQYEMHGYPVFHHELVPIVARRLLGLECDDLGPDYVEYVVQRRRKNGSFNNTLDSDGGDGHVMNTLWGLQALEALGRGKERQSETIEWLQACQVEDGGFRYQPNPELGEVVDLVYTWAAVRALALLGAKPANLEKCRQAIESLANEDGGFASRAGWPSQPMATYQALDALRCLGASETPLTQKTSSGRPGQKPPKLPGDLKVYSIQIEAHGTGSPTEAVTLASELKIDLWGAKNAKREWLARAQAIAGERKVPVTFFVANEEYGTWVNVPGLGTYSHTSDLFAPAGSDIGASLAGAGVVSWPQFRERRLKPLHAAKGRVFWQFGENEELTRVFLDDSLLKGGFSAISTFHFGNPDFTNSESFLCQYRGRIPFIALQDAHGPEPWWFADMTTGFRTLFLAREPTWDGWLEALRNNWTAAVRHDAVSGEKTWLHAGSDEVLKVVKEQEARWRWWDNPEISRPLVSLVAIRPEDPFETGRPERGIALRVRCAWENTTQGQPKRPLVKLVSLQVDGKTVDPRLVDTPMPNGKGLLDQYHLYLIEDPTPGKHHAETTVLEIRTGREIMQGVEFQI